MCKKWRMMVFSICRNVVKRAYCQSHEILTSRGVTGLGLTLHRNVFTDYLTAMAPSWLEQTIWYFCHWLRVGCQRSTRTLKYCTIACVSWWDTRSFFMQVLALNCSKAKQRREGFMAASLPPWTRMLIYVHIYNLGITSDKAPKWPQLGTI